MALVTGGSRGIGAGIVRRLVAEGANVFFTYVSSEEKAEKLVKEMAGFEGKVRALKADTSKTEDIDAAVKAAAALGKIDILVNNAGVFVTGAIDDKASDLDSLAKQWTVNVTGITHMVRGVLPYMGDGGRIITIGSTGASRSPFPGLGDYAAGKAALAAYTRSWARDLGPRNITVNIIQPGLINTDMNPADGPFSSHMLQSVALGRYGDPGDIGGSVAFLASDDAQYITGITLNIDGGQSA